MPLPSGGSGFPEPPFSTGPLEPSFSFPPPPPPKFQSRLWLHALLFLLTLASTTHMGAWHYASFIADFGRQPLQFELIPGLWYSATILAILGAHEMGHYVLCRRYNVDATLPYFLPLPIIMTGTLGAVIKIREAFPNRRALFDIGIAGPIAGFVVLVPALFVGLRLSTIVPAPPPGLDLVNFGEPLLFQWGASMVFGELPPGHVINMHPMVFAAWFGMLATALNLLPFGQLDGGHITYAVLGRASTPISIATVASAVVMTFVSISWLFMTVMMVVMLFLLGPRHPRVIYEYERLGRGRQALAVGAFLILAVCFTPVPVEFIDFIRNP